MKAHHPLMSKISDPWKVIYKGTKHYEELGTSLPLSGKKLWKEGHSRKIKTTIIHTFRGVPFYTFLFSSSISSHSYHREKRIKMKWPLKFCLAQRKQLASTKWLLWLPDLEMAFFLCAKRSFPNDHYFLTLMSTLLLTTAVEIFTHTVLKRTKWSFCSCLFYSWSKGSSMLFWCDKDVQENSLCCKIRLTA